MSHLHIDLQLRRHDFRLDFQCDVDIGIVGFYGASGAGKSTILNLIAGLARPSGGRIILNKRVLYDEQAEVHIPAEQRGVGYVFQDYRLFPHLSVKNNLRYGLPAPNRKNDNISMNTVVEMLQLEPLLHKHVKQISGGQQQRVALGRALLTQPQLMLLDEPFAALDVPLRLQVIRYLRSINRQWGLPMIVVSHELKDLLRLTDLLVMVENGRASAHGSMHELLMRRQAPALLKGELINRVEGEVVRTDTTGGLLVLRHTGGVELVVEPNEDNEAMAGMHVQVEIRPEDVTLARQKITQISVQNQWHGKLMDVVTSNAKVLCLIDVGFTLAVEVTHATATQMHLSAGTEVWCLVKAAAMKYSLLSG